MHVYFQIIVFSQYGSYGSSIFSFLRDLHAVLPSGCQFMFPPKYRRLSFSPHPFQYSLLTFWWWPKLPRSVGAQYATGDQWRNNSRKNEGMEPKQKQYPVVDVTSDRSNVQCCKEQYCIGTWNVRSMNQGKLEVVKQEMVRVNVNILGINELKWTGGWI